MEENTEQGEWLTAKEAAEIISVNSGRQVDPDYLNQLRRSGKLEPRKLDERTNLYRRSQVEKIRVRKRNAKPQEKSSEVERKL